MNTKPHYDILMRTRNSEEYLTYVLNALFAQREIEFTLHVIDSGSEDKTLSILSAYPHKLTKISPTDYIPGAVMNRLVAGSKSEVVVFLNSDSILLSPYSIHTLTHRVNSQQIAAVIGRQIPHPTHSAWVQRDYSESFPEYGRAPWIFGSAPLMCVSRRVWSERPFDESIIASEDSEWGHWAISQNYKVLYEPFALTMHSHDYSLSEMFRRKFIEGEADVFIFNKKYSCLNLLRDAVVMIVKDCIWAIKNSSYKGLLYSFPLRFVAQLGYWRGIHWGRKRRRDSSINLEESQKVALKNHRLRN